MTAVIAIIVDSYRELIAKKMFWFVLTISALIVVSFGSIGFNDKGVSIGYGLYTIESPTLRAGSFLIKPFMDFAFATVIVKVWLAWGAIILALVSTAEVFPNFLAGGSIDLVLSKPVRRTTIFFTKYLGSLLFVLMQVTIFCVGTLLVMRFRVGEWRWAILVAIPILVLVFSYLYSVMVLCNILTRSTLPSLVLTLFFWMTLFSLHLTHGILYTQFRLGAEVDAEAYTKRIDWYDQRIDQAESEHDEDAKSLYEGRLRDAQAKLDDAQRRVAKWTPIEQLVRLMTYVVPRTSSTTDLVQRQLDTHTKMTSGEFFRAMGADGGPQEPPPEVLEDASSRDAQERRQDEIARRAQADELSQSPWSIIGTSLTFEGAVLLIACFVFVRRDN